MTTVNRGQIAEIRKRFCDAGQGHVFNWWDDITSSERDALYKQLVAIDLDVLEHLVEKLVVDEPNGQPRHLEPSPIIHLPRTPQEHDFREKALTRGEEILRSGLCAAFVAAGGGDSDLEIGGVKGMYPMTPVTGKTLFQLHTEKVLGLRARYGCTIPLFVMTSADNHDAIREFFEAHDHFGFPAEDLFFLPQGMLPLVDFSGNLILEERGRLAMKPDGHGGAIRALYNSGALDELEERGIKYIFYFQVDNPLAKILDPAFIGYHAMSDAEISSKAVRKKNPDEKVGVLGRINGWIGVVEHSDLTKEEKYARDEKGELRFFAGNIAIHLMNVSFLRRLSESPFNLAFHKSERAVRLVDKKGDTVEPTQKNALRFESFVFDALQYANASIILEVPREDEFSPFKRLEGEESPECCREMMSRYYKGWLRRCGFEVDPEDGARVEISPLFALDEEAFRHRILVDKSLLVSKLYIE